MENIGKQNMNIRTTGTLLLLFFSNLLLAEITVNVDRSLVVVDESFQLIFESDQKIDVKPDFSPLNKSFKVLKNEAVKKFNMFGNKVSHSQQWILTVVAKRTGKLSIPPIRFGKEFSKTHSIKVLASTPSTQDKNTDDILIEVEVNTKTPYVQAQLIYTVKLYRAVVTNNASLSEPEISGEQAIINKLGKDRSFETQRNGKRYAVIQRQYAIFPQSSGALKIEPLIFRGQTGAGRFFNFNPFGPQPKSIVKHSAEINLDVKPIPDSFTGETWLPASQLSIQEQWSVDPGKLQQGEATTRTITIKAIGLAASNIPAVDNKLPNKFKQYPDQPEFEEINNTNSIIGIRRDKIAIVPTKDGDFILPAIRIPWWNTITDKMEIAELAERIIYVDATVTASIENTIKKEVVTKEITSNEPNNSDENIIKTIDSSSGESPWKWTSMILFILWLTTLIILWKSKRHISVPDARTETELSSRYYLKQIKQACKKNNPAMTKHALLKWANIIWPDNKVSSIGAIKNYADAKFKMKLDELNHCLYGNKTGQWNGVEVLESFKSQSFKNIKPSVATGNLEPLYKP